MVLAPQKVVFSFSSLAVFPFCQMKVLDSVCKGCVYIFTSRECERKLIAAALSVSGEMARQCSSVGNAVGNVVIVLGKVRQCKAMAQQWWASIVGKHGGQVRQRGVRWLAVNRRNPSPDTQRKQRTSRDF